jgi:hypothetical protein
MKTILRVLLICGVLGSLRAEAAQVWVGCTPVDVATYAERVHVRCTSSISGVRFFAVATTDAPAAARFVSVATSALVAGRTLTVLYDPADTSGPTFGCQTSDCRRALALAIQR